MISYACHLSHRQRAVKVVLVGACRCPSPANGLGERSGGGIMNGRLNGKIAIITGATLGIGRATAERFAAEGAKLVLVARRPELGEELVSLLGKDKATFVTGDVADPATAAEAVAVATRLGSLDVLVNNAGIDFTSDLLETALEDVRRVLEVNFLGAFLMLKEAARTMRSS